MKRLLFIVFVLTGILALNALVIESGSLREFLYGSDESLEYDNYVSHVSEGIAVPNYNYYAPFDPQTNGFGDFIIPNATQLNHWSAISQAFVNQEWDTAQNLLDTNNYPYNVVQFNDTDFDRTYYMLRERLNDQIDINHPQDPDDDVYGSFDYGWGCYIFNPEATNPIVITAPHLMDDFSTIVTAYHTFTKWDSMFLLLSGAGREVKWTNVPPYYNSKSISDPTRNLNHPFNRSYQKFCDHIRTTFGRLEFSAQMHGYDYADRHTGYANTQVSAGGTRPNPNLPIWDHSNSGQDLIHWSDEIIFPANTFGIHDEVTRNDYYAVYNQVYDLYVDDDPDNPINTEVDLWGYSENRQMQYTLTGTTDWDVVDPFFHIEIDELPDVYEQTEANYKWFYGYDPITDRYVKENIYTMTENYYTYWIDRMAENLDSFLRLDVDSQAPPIPENLQIVALNYNDITLSWNPVSHHNFKSYEILYSTTPFTGDDASIFDRNNNPRLADMKLDNVKITGLTPNTDYYFRIRAVDYADNYSSISTQINGTTTPFRINSIAATAQDPFIMIEWYTTNESNVALYKVFRRDLGSEEWEQVSGSIVSNNAASLNTYIWYDENVQMGAHYQYKVNGFDMVGNAYKHDIVVDAHASNFLNLIVSNANDTVTDQVTFGVNADASDGYDHKYDVTSSTSGSGNYILAAFYEPYYAAAYRYLKKNIYGDIDLTHDYKQYALQIKSNQLNQQLKVTLDNFSADRFSKKVWLKESNSNFVDLTEEPLYFTTSNQNFKTFTLYYGNINPNLTMAAIPAFKIHHPNDLINLQWSYNNNELLDYYRLDLISPTDSLNIDDNVAPDTYFYQWLIPFGTRIEDAKFVITAFATDGEVRRFESSWTMGVLPKAMTYSFDEEWQMVSHVWESEAPTINELFGTGASLTQYAPAQFYEPTLFYNFGQGYWANLPQAHESTIEGNIHQSQVTVNIHQGWNLLGNPYPSEMELSSLLFNVDGQDYAVGEMISYGLISRGIFVHREDGYELAHTVKGMEGFYLYSEIGEFNIVTMKYTPYRHYYGLDTLPLEWSAKIVAEANGDRDNFVIGISDYATTWLGSSLNFPKAPLKPYAGVDIYDCTDAYNDEREDERFYYYQQKFQPHFANSDEVKTWVFKVNARTLEPITLTFNSEDFPTGELYSAIEFNGVLHHFNLQHDFEFTPTEIGEYQFMLKISPTPVGNEDGNVTPVANLFSVYPNPFNPETTIAFDVKQEGKVELAVYNLKGQKVKNLCNDVMTAGRKQIVWNGTNSNNKSVASGIYFMKLNIAGEKSRLKKVMLMK